MIFSICSRDKRHAAIPERLGTLLQIFEMGTIKLTTEQFKEQVFNYEGATEWSYSGALPAIVDFYADWCGPCKMVAPILEDLAKEYEGKLLIYKVDTDAEQELSAVFGIQSIPTLLFIPVGSQPMMQPGALPKAALKQIINDHLVVKQD